MQYIEGVGTTLVVTAVALALGVVLGGLVALVRVTHDQQRPHRRNPVLGVVNAVLKVYVTVIRGTPDDGAAADYEHGDLCFQPQPTRWVGALTLGINSGAYVSEIIRGGLMAGGPRPDGGRPQPGAGLPSRRWCAS